MRVDPWFCICSWRTKAAEVVAEQMFATAGLYGGWEVVEGIGEFTITGVFPFSPTAGISKQGGVDLEQPLSAGSRKYTY